MSHATSNHYYYLTNQAGSVTGMTQDGQAVASSSYNLYGSTKKSTDITGNPFAYNGEARDATGLDYLRARYYDSSAGTFLTEDSYQGELTDPLSQNRYSYVHNNPVNYNDPSGHFWNSIKKAASNVWNGVKKTASNAWNGVKKTASNVWNGVKKAASNAWNTVKRVATNTWNSVKSAYNTAVNWVSNKVNQAVNWVGQQANRVYHAGQQVYQSASSYAQAQYQQLQAQIQARREQAVRNEYAQATGIKGTPKSREAMNLLRNWGAALAKTLKHVCTTADRVGKQIMKVTKKIDWEKTVPVIKYGAAFASGLVSGLDKIGQGLDASNSLGGILRNINPIAKMGGKTGFVIQNTSSVFYKAGTLFNKIGQKVAPVAKVLTSKTFQAVGFVAGVADDIANQGKTFGQAVAHNGAGLAVGATALALTPVGWGVVGAAAVGVVAGFAFDAAYNSNFLGIRDGLDWVGSKIDKGLNKLFNPPRRSIILV